MKSERKIIFVVGSLENAKDGVADYCTVLAKNLKKLGCDIKLLSLNDRFIENDIKQINKNEIELLRIPENYTWQKKKELAKKFIENFSPDLISLQYVCYAWQKKGLPIGLEKHLVDIFKGHNLHIMFHELWIGTEKEDSLYHKLIGFIQKNLLRKLAKTLEQNSKKIIFSTSIPYYQDLLKSIKINANILEIFSNIEISKETFDPKIYKEQAIKTFNLDPEKHIYVLFFGIHRTKEENINNLIKYLEDLKTKEKKEISLIAAGHNSSAGNTWQEIKNKTQNKFQIKELGPQNEENLKQLFAVCDFAVSFVEEKKIGKSGSLRAIVDSKSKMILFQKGNNNAPQQENTITLNSTKPNQFHNHIVPKISKESSADLCAKKFCQIYF